MGGCLAKGMRSKWQPPSVWLWYLYISMHMPSGSVWIWGVMMLIVWSLSDKPMCSPFAVIGQCRKENWWHQWRQRWITRNALLRYALYLFFSISKSFTYSYVWYGIYTHNQIVSSGASVLLRRREKRVLNAHMEFTTIIMSCRTKS